jgi:hypothetical protein
MPPLLATLTVRAVAEGGTPYGAGVYLRVEEIPIGRTAASGTLKARVPPGPVRVTAIIPPTTFGETFVTVTSTGPNTATVTLDGGKEPVEETDLVLIEAKDGALPRTTSSLTFRFMRDERSITLRSVVAVETLDQFDSVDKELDEFFSVEDSAIRAIDVAPVFAALASNGVLSIRIRVTAIDKEEFLHSNVVEFRLE